MPQVTTRKIVNETIVTERDGRRVLLVLPQIPEGDAPYAVREGIARRRITALRGECPCGAIMARDSTAEAVHESRCPAVTKVLLKAIRRWAR